MELTRLQRRIKAEALRFIRRDKDYINQKISEATVNTIRFAIMTDMVVDFLDYDISTKEFTVNYEVGVGKGFSMCLDSSAGWYDETVTKSFSFPSPYNFNGHPELIHAH